MPIIAICEVCRRQYKAKPSTIVDTHFCSTRCQERSFLLTPGTRFGRWTVLSYVRRAKSQTLYLCHCDCGTVSAVGRNSLTSGSSKSCGCYHKEVSAEHARNHFTKHGLSKERWYLQHLKHRRYHCDRTWTIGMEQLLFRLQPVCVICQRNDELEIDHVVPFISGGMLLPGNAVVLCRSCNATKHDRDLDELPHDWQEKILTAAHEFERQWNAIANC
jgi:5-methylcytosine-specific restriction endonuclease McrA